MNPVATYVLCAMAIASTICCLLRLVPYDAAASS